jgi:hypothetical protein
MGVADLLMALFLIDRYGVHGFCRITSFTCKYGSGPPWSTKAQGRASFATPSVTLQLPSLDTKLGAFCIDLQFPVPLYERLPGPFPVQLESGKWEKQ